LLRQVPLPRNKPPVHPSKRRRWFQGAGEEVDRYKEVVEMAQAKQKKGKKASPVVTGGKKVKKKIKK